MAKVRLLELRNTYKWGGGPDKTILLSAERHDPSRVSVVVAYVRDVRDNEFKITDKMKSRKFTYYEIPEKGKFDPSVLRALQGIVEKHDINLIHGHDYKTDFFAYLLRKWYLKRPVKLVSTAHAWVMIGPRGWLYRRLDLWLMNRFDHLIAVSEATKAEMVSAGIPDRSITVIHNGIDTDTWSPGSTPEDLRDALGFKGVFPVIGYVGRVMPEKDLETWILSAATVAEHYPQAQFLLVGDGRDSSTLEQLNDLGVRLGIQDRLNFIGYRENLLPVYATMDLFVLSSLREGLPNSVLEAMAMGLPVVSTDVGGTRELVADGETGYIVPQKDPDRLSEAVLNILSSDQRRLGMGRAGRMRTEEKFSFDRRLRRVEALYEHILSGGS